MLAALERERRVDEQVLGARREVEVVDLGDGASTSRRLQKLEAERARLARQQRDLAGRCRALLLQPPDLRHLRLRLLRLVLLGAEALDEPFEARDVDRDAVGGLLRVLRALRLLEPPRMPGAGEERRAARDQFERRVRDRLEEPAVVRDEDHAGVERLQLALQPLEARDVEVVRRLVEQDQVGVAAERARQRGARQLPARERGERTVEVDLREAQPAHDGVRALAPRVAPGVLEPRLRFAVAAERRRVVRAGAHRLLEPPQLLLRRDQVARTREDVLAERERAVERRPLVVQRDARPLLERELAAVELGLSRQKPEQGRLAGPVRAGERDAVAALDLEGDAVEQDVSAELLLEVGCDDHCHRSKCRGRG